MTVRIATATRLGFREQARRPLLVVLLLVLPFFFITRAIAGLSRRRGSSACPEAVMSSRR